MSELMTREDVRYAINTIVRETHALELLQTHDMTTNIAVITPISELRTPQSNRETKACQTLAPERVASIIFTLAWMYFVFAYFDDIETNLANLEPPGLTISRFRSFGRFYLAHRTFLGQVHNIMNDQMRQEFLEQFKDMVITEEQPAAESEMKGTGRRLRY